MSTTGVTTKINDSSETTIQSVNAQDISSDTDVAMIETENFWTMSHPKAPDLGEKIEGSLTGIVDEGRFHMPIVARQCHSANAECIERAVMFPSLYHIDGLYSVSISYGGHYFGAGFLIEGNKAPQPVFGSLKRQGYTVSSLQGYFWLLPLGTYLMIKDQDVGMLADILNNPQFDPKRLSIDY